MEANKKKCPVCKKFVSPTAEFCIFCGEPLESDNAEEKISMQEPAPTPMFKPVSAPAAETQPVSVKSVPEKNGESDSSTAVPTHDAENDFTPEPENTPAPETNGKEVSSSQTANQIVEDDPEEEVSPTDDNAAFRKMLFYENEDNLSDDSTVLEDTESKRPSSTEELRESFSKKLKNGVSGLPKFPKPQKKGASPIAPKNNPENGANTTKFEEDSYYDNLLGLVDAEREHITAENVIKTVSIVAVFLIVLVGCLYFF